MMGMLTDRLSRRWGKWEDRTGTFNAVSGVGAHWAKLNAMYSVQAYIRDGGWLQLMVRRHDGKPDVPWRDLQRIKDELVGEMHEAIEVYPRSDDTVDSANMYHLWVLPPGANSFGAMFRKWLGMPTSWPRDEGRNGEN